MRDRCAPNDDGAVPDSSDEHPDFRACLEVWSRELRLDDLTQSLGREPSREESTDIGDQSSWPGAAPKMYAAWRLELVFDDFLHRGCNGLGFALRDLGHDLADRARELADRGCHVTVSVEQHLDPDDPQTDGIHLDEFAVAWLARAGACLDIDQYAKEATLGAAVRSWFDDRMWDMRELRGAARKRSRTIPVVRHLVPLGPEERRPPGSPPSRIDRLRPAARRLLEELITAADLPAPEGGSEQEDWTAWATALRQHTDMLSEVASGGRPGFQDLRDAREFRMRATSSIQRWPERWSLLAEADGLLDVAV